MDLPEEELVAFLEECAGQLEEAESALMSLEDEFDLAQVNLVFRMVHSVKGGAGFFGLNRLKALAHDLESSFDLMRSGHLQAQPELISLLLRGLDRLKEMVLQGKASESMEIQDLLFELQAYLGNKQNSSQQVHKVSISLDVETLTQKLAIADESIQFKWLYLLAFKDPSGGVDSLLASAGQCLGTLHPADFEHEYAEAMVFASVMERDLVEVLVPGAQVSLLRTAKNEWQIPEHAPAKKAEKPQVAASKEKGDSKSSAGEGTLRISVSVLENLMNLAGELVLARNQMLNSVGNKDFHQIQMSAARISQVTTELQESIMQTRMQPLGVLFQRYPRLVRDLAKQLGKNVELIVEGKDVEVDKAIIEGLADPLTHMVRNSMDHGLENSADRLEQGKAEQGRVWLRAWHEAGQVVIELKDDGRGIRGDKVAAKAFEKGLIPREQYENMSFNEQVQLIFLPGLSTADQVSDVSGRGVGMDVVKANIEKLGGKIEIKTELGSGSSFRVRLPLTLAIIPSLLVECAGETFAIPQTNVSELVRIPADQLKSKVYQLGDSQILDLRGELIPLIRLDMALKLQAQRFDETLGIWVEERRIRLADRRSPVLFEKESTSRSDSDRRQNSQEALQIAVVDAGGFRYGLVVNRLNDTQEIVVKPLELWARESKEYAGATILGNGKIALIIDVSGLAHGLGIHKIVEQVGSSPQNVEILDQDLSTARLVFQSSPGQFCALSTQHIARIEPISHHSIETRMGQRIVNIQGKLLKLMSPEDLGLGAFSADQEVVALVLRHESDEFGFLAARPLDVLASEGDESFDLHLSSNVETTQVLRGRTTMVLSVESIYECFINTQQGDLSC